MKTALMRPECICKKSRGNRMKQEQKVPWWKRAVAYQIYPRSFLDTNGDGVGDLRGIIKKLDYLSYLGIDLIWICPIYDSANDDNGYDIRDYEKIQAEYGTMEDFDELLCKAHEKGIRIIMDLVINHTSDEHAWFIESKSAKDSKKRDWYIWKDGKTIEKSGEMVQKEPNNWESIFGKSAWKYDETTGQYFLHVFSEKMPDINWECKEAKEEVFRMVNWWLDKGIDGFRIDAISHIKKNDFTDMPNPKHLDYVSSFDKHMNQPGIQDLLQELKEKTFEGRDVFTIAEASGVSFNEMSEWISTREGKFSSIFQFEHQHLWSDVEDEAFDLRKLKQVLSKWQEAVKEDGWIALFLENHDLVRCVNRFGNTASYWNESAKALALMYFMQKGIPFIYQGQEIGMVNADYESPYDFNDTPSIFAYENRVEHGMGKSRSFKILKQTTRDNSRTPMQWDETKNAGFSTGNPWMKVNRNYASINVKSQIGKEDSILEFYRKMIHLKKSSNALLYGDYKLVMENSRDIFAYERSLCDETYFICTNLSENLVKLSDEYVFTDKEMILSNYKSKPERILKPYEAYVLKL